MATLYFIATPIGNLEDISHRALRVLGVVDAVACEDTRVTWRIFERYGIKPPETRFSCHEHNEEQAAKRVMGLLDAGQSVALCTDGGHPGISDPGYRLAALCHERGHRLEVIPGPSAATTALVASGLSTSSFTFKGFPPRKSGQRRRFFAMDRDLPHTLIVYESPFRVGQCLADAHAALGNRLAAVCLELTKKFEAVHRGWLADLAGQFKGKEAKGEVTIVISGNNPKFRSGDDTGSDDGFDGEEDGGDGGDDGEMASRG